MSRLTASATVLLAAAIWGTAFYFQKTAMDHVGPLLFVGLRGLLASLALLPFALWESRSNTRPLHRVFPFAMIGGGIFFVASTIQQFGIKTATVTNTGFLTALYVVFAPFLVWALQGQRPGIKVWISVILATIGIWALGGGTLAALSGGDILIACSALFWALFMVVTGIAGREAKPLQTTCLTFVILAILGWSGAWLLEDISWTAIKAAAPALLFVGILSSALTYALIAMAVRHIPTTTATLLLSTETLFSAGMGYVMLGERLTPIGWAGAALLLAAVVMVQWKSQAAVHAS
jgi:drug/metabolite transporter (DMT)-like permease